MRVRVGQLAISFVLLFALQQAQGQGSARLRTHLSFAVATIKPSKASVWKLQPTPSGYTAIGASLRDLVREAYGVYDEKLLRGGPSWVDSERFDLEARVDESEVIELGKLSFRQRADMLKPLLAERFGLLVHFESHIFPVYDLVVGKSGPKLNPTKEVIKAEKGMPTASCFIRQNRPGFTQREDCTVTSLEDLLHEAAGRSVLDKTGLTGHYDFELRWETQIASLNEQPSKALPDIFTALGEQLGLRLEPSTAPLDVLMIDHVERRTDN